jgi:hypothetical protein
MVKFAEVEKQSQGLLGADQVENPGKIEETDSREDVFCVIKGNLCLVLVEHVGMLLKHSLQIQNIGIDISIETATHIGQRLGVGSMLNHNLFGVKLKIQTHQT